MLDSRADIAEAERRPFHLYVDEFQQFANGAFDTILSQARKFRLLLTLSHQYMGRLPPRLHDAILGNSGTSVAFRVGATDARELSPHLGLGSLFEQAELDGAQQLTDLANYQAFVRTLIDGAPETFRLAPFPPPAPANTRPANIKNYSRSHYGRDAATIEARIHRLYGSPQRMGE